MESFHRKHATKKPRKTTLQEGISIRTKETEISKLNIHVFTPANCICSPFPLFFHLLLPLLPTLIGMIVSEQFMPTDWARIVLILPQKNAPGIRKENFRHVVRESSGGSLSFFSVIVMNKDETHYQPWL